MQKKGEGSSSGLHQISMDKLFAKVDSTPKGLSQKEATLRQQKFGFNVLTEKKEKPWYVKFLLQFKNFFSILLLIGALLSFLGEYLQQGEGYLYIAIALLGVTILNAVFTFVQEYKTQQAMRSFANLMSAQVVVFRDVERVKVNSKELVVGDVIELAEGDRIAADARILVQSSLKVDHAALTGESEPQLRSLKATSLRMLLSRNMVFSGTLVQQGSGKAVVVATGDNTQIGKIAKQTTEIGEQTSHLQKQIGVFIKVISRIAMVLGVVFFSIGFLIQVSHMSVLDAFIVNLVFAIGIIVANVPEGLLPTVTLTLSIAAQKLAKRQVLIKNIDAIETIGSVTVICSDKTGTLTENNLSVVGTYINGEVYKYDKSHSVLRQGDKTIRSESVAGFTDILEISTLCNNAQITHSTFGDPLDVALAQFSRSFINIDHFREESPRFFEVPFSSETKYMAVAHTIDSVKECLVKGAPEIVLEKCTHIFENGKIKALTATSRSSLLAQNTEFAKKGYRVLAFGRKNLTGKPEPALTDGDYVFYGFVFMQDPPRHEVPAAVALTKEAGIRIIVISGDQGTTVASIAQQVGIIDGEAHILTGDMLLDLTDTQLKTELLKRNVIVSRALPRDKLRIVTLLQEMGEIVAVTGDGVNDAPAIKKADVGIAMGKSGTEVAKEASDIILLDDNFASITRAIHHGRTIYDNIKHFITYILTSNTPQIIPFLAFVMFGWPLALPTLLILAIDLGTDMLPAIALGIEKPGSDVMRRKPREPNSKLLTWKMILRSYGCVGLIQTTIAYFIFFSILRSGGWSFGTEISMHDPLYFSAVAGFFMAVVVTQIFNLLSCRTTRTSALLKPLGGNWLLVVGVAVSLLLVALMVFVEPIRTVFGLNFFDFKYVWWAFGLGSIILVIEEIRKFFLRRNGWFSLD